MDIKGQKWDLLYEKHELKHAKPSLKGFMASKFGQNHGILYILDMFSQTINIFTPKCYTFLERYGNND